eukprot:365404-Chlamydomonas_euryale.AAC.4
MEYRERGAVWSTEKGSCLEYKREEGCMKLKRGCIEHRERGGPARKKLGASMQKWGARPPSRRARPKKGRQAKTGVRMTIKPANQLTLGECSGA